MNRFWTVMAMLGLGIIVTSLVIMLVWGLFLRPAHGAVIKPGDDAPDFQAAGLDGKTVRLSDLKGKFVILNFWATWCGYCVQEFPSMQKMSKEHPEIVILTINHREDRETVKKFADKHVYSFTFLLDPDGSINGAYQVGGLPTSYFIGKDGKVVKRIVGGVDWQSPQMQEVIKNFLENK